MSRQIRLSKEQLQYILDNHDKLSLRKIGQNIGCSHEWVNNILKKNNIVKKRVKVSKIRRRECRGGCGIVIENDRHDNYCPRCRHIVMAKTYHKINQKLRMGQRTYIHQANK